MVRHAQQGGVHEEAIALSRSYRACALLLLCLVTGCTGRTFAELRPGLETRGSYIEGVPFYQQSGSICGPAALASIFEFRGRPESPERITAKMNQPGLGCALPIDMEEYARAAGFKAVSHKSSFGELKANIRKGTPVICMLDLGSGFNHQLQYVSVIGYDDVKQVVIMHDNVSANSVISYKKFNKRWVRANYWMLVIEPRSAEASQ